MVNARHQIEVERRHGERLNPAEAQAILCRMTLLFRQMVTVVMGMRQRKQQAPRSEIPLRLLLMHADLYLLT